MDDVIKAMKQAAVDADISIKKLEHEVLALAKDKSPVSLEKRHD